MTISPRLGLSDTESGARSLGKTGSGLAGVIENEGCDRQSEADGVDDVERKDGGTVTGDARIEGKATATAKKKPAYCALISLMPPALMIPSPSFAAKVSGAAALPHAVNRQNRTLIASTAVPNIDDMAKTFPEALLVQ
jgi:hypothetical protein